jgi:hypothetical protein
MKLTDLRDELTSRANSTGETPDLLSGVHRKIARTKRRRRAGAAGVAGGLAAIAAFAFVIPSLTTSTPQPADDVPRDYVKDGMVMPGLDGDDRLEKAWIGDRGENTIDFSWTPARQVDLRFSGLCNSDSTQVRYFTVWVNDYVVGTDACIQDEDLGRSGIGVLADGAMWLPAPAGKPAKVIAKLTDENGRPVADQHVQVALGIYQSAAAVYEGSPVRTPPTSAADYVKDGVRYRAKIGGRMLLGAQVADQGESRFEFTFKAPGVAVSLSDFCTAALPGTDPQYQLSVRFNGVLVSTGSCPANSLDAGTGTSFVPGVAPPPAGQQVKVTVQLEDKSGRPVTRPKDWIGLGIYTRGEQQIIDGTSLAGVVEHGGYNYRLTEVKHVPLTIARTVTISTPAGKPFLISYGSTKSLSEGARVSLTGLDGGASDSAGGVSTIGQAAIPAGSATATVEGAGQNTAAEVFVALYLPE